MQHLIKVIFIEALEITSWLWSGKIRCEMERKSWSQLIAGSENKSGAAQSTNINLIPTHWPGIVLVLIQIQFHQF